MFAKDPGLVNAVHFRLGCTPLFTLPDDEEAAAEMTTVLLAHGADPGIRNKDGVSAEESARRRGLIDAADLMAAG